MLRLRHGDAVAFGQASERGDIQPLPGVAGRPAAVETAPIAADCATERGSDGLRLVGSAVIDENLLLDAAGVRMQLRDGLCIDVIGVEQLAGERASRDQLAGLDQGLHMSAPDRWRGRAEAGQHVGDRLDERVPAVRMQMLDDRLALCGIGVGSRR